MIRGRTRMRQATKGWTRRRHTITGQMRRRACGDGEDKEETGKDGADEEADDCGDDEQMKMEAEGILARTDIASSCFLITLINITFRSKLFYL